MFGMLISCGLGIYSPVDGRWTIMQTPQQLEAETAQRRRGEHLA